MSQSKGMSLLEAVVNMNEMDDGICPTCMDELQEESGEGV